MSNENYDSDVPLNSSFHLNSKLTKKPEALVKDSDSQRNSDFHTQIENKSSVNAFKCPISSTKKDSFEKNGQTVFNDNAKDSEVLATKYHSLNRELISQNSKHMIKSLYVLHDAHKTDVSLKDYLKKWVDCSEGQHNVIELSFEESQLYYIEKLINISPTRRDTIQRHTCAFVLGNFEGPIFETLCIKRYHVFGPTFIIEYLSDYGVCPIVPPKSLPVYSTSMSKVVAVFDGFSMTENKNISNLSKKVQYMHGTVQNYLTSSTTHLVIPNVSASLYNRAVQRNLIIVDKSWIEECWSHRNEQRFQASYDTTEPFLVKPFAGLKLYLYGFCGEQLALIEKEAVRCGADLCKYLSDETTHVVCSDKASCALDEQFQKDVSKFDSISTMSVNWFWKCIQSELCFQYDVRLSSSSKTDVDSSNVITSNDKNAEAVFLTKYCMLENSDEQNCLLDEFSNESEILPNPNPSSKPSLKKASTLYTNKTSDISKSKQRHLSEDNLKLSFSEDDRKAINNEKNNKIVDNEEEIKKKIDENDAADGLIRNVENTPPKANRKITLFKENVSSNVVEEMRSYVRLASISSRYTDINVEQSIVEKRTAVIDEFITTEKNYVNILKTIIDVFRDPLFKQLEKQTKLMISLEDFRFCFDSFPKIHALHSQFLFDLTMAKKHMSKKHVFVGILLLAHVKGFPSAYGQLVNFYSIIIGMLSKLIDNSPRFNAFVKLCEANRRCHKEDLLQLMIRPIQRLPSMILLLEEIMKLVSSNEPDYSCLVTSMSILKSIVSRLNREKKEVDSKLRLYSILNAIDSCPPEIISMGREIVLKFEATEKKHSKIFTSNGRNLLVYLMNDSIEIASKKLLKIFSEATLESTKAEGANVDQIPVSICDKDKPYKHHVFVEFKNIHCIYLVNKKSSKSSEKTQENTTVSCRNSAFTSDDVDLISSEPKVDFIVEPVNNTIGILYFVDKYYYNIVYFKINGKDAISDKKVLLKTLAPAILKHRNLSNYNDVVIPVNQYVTKRDDLYFQNELKLDPNKLYTEANAFTERSRRDSTSTIGSVDKFVPEAKAYAAVQRRSRVSINYGRKPEHAFLDRTKSGLKKLFGSLHKVKSLSRVSSLESFNQCASNSNCIDNNQNRNETQRSCVSVAAPRSRRVSTNSQYKEKKQDAHVSSAKVADSESKAKPQAIPTDSAPPVNNIHQKSKMKSPFGRISFSFR